MVNKCHCYHTQQKTRYTYHPLTGSPIPHDIEVGICWGTKECDECNCGGDETKCDFYPKVREKANSISHADYIRSADDKNLAEILVDIGWDCTFCSEHERLENEPLLRGEKCDDHCIEHCLEWLKQKVKNN